MGKIRKTFLIMIGTILVWSHLPYHYNNEEVAANATAHASGGSRCMCAWYVVKAMWRGGCPIGLIPAYAYEKTLPQMGFYEIPTNGYRPMTGDISVLPQNEKSHFGHIAAWNDKQWVSDFKQKTSIQEENIEAWGAIEYSVLLTAGIGNMCGHHRLIGTLGLNH